MTPEDIQELYERRLSDKVAASVEQAIRRRYAWIGAVALVATWAGGAALIRTMIQGVVDEEVKLEVAAHIKDYENIKSYIIQTDVTAKSEFIELEKGLDALKLRRKEMEDVLGETRNIADETRRKVDEITKSETILEQNINQSNLTVSQTNQRVQQQILDLNNATKSVAQLADNIQHIQANLVALANGKSINVVTNDMSSTQRIADSVRQSTSSISEPIVYFEFAGDQARSTAEQIAEKLRAGNVRIPGLERVSAKINEVRYYYDEDKGLAERVAENATRIARELGLGDTTIKPISFTSYSKVKPPVNTVELWMDLSQSSR